MKKSTIIITISAIAVIGIILFFIATRNCSSCSKDSAVSLQACNNCGKSSCNKECSPEIMRDPSKIKSSLPSCNLSSKEMLERKDVLQKGIFSKIKSVQELATGFQLTFNEPKEFSKDLLEFINFEQGCCSSFTYALIFEPNNKATHLQLYGSKEIKEELRAGLIELGALK